MSVRGIRGNLSALSMQLQRNFEAEFHPENVSFKVKQQISVSEPPLGGLGLTYAFHL